MAKLTLAFKDRKLKIFPIPPGESLIGRDPDCLICIDSLAVEPRHARITSSAQSTVIEPCETNTIVRINEQAISAPHPLHEGDLITVGKHSLSFSEETGGTVLDPAVIRRPRVGWLQIQSGSHLGRTIRLDKAFTRIGKSDIQLAIIARRDDGFHISHLLGTSSPSVNSQDIGEATHKLKSGDEIAVGELRVQFFADVGDEPESEAPQSPQPAGAQRQFSRIPFDVPATLCLHQQSWETTLVDISLHGALVRIPPGFECAADSELQLKVHLQGGPDINMDVAIAHREDQQLGLRCRDIDVDSITCLRRLIELNLGNPDLIEREVAALGTV